MLAFSLSRFPLLLLALLGPLASLAQAPGASPASPLPRLLAERRQLTQHYAAANAQRHSLFGLTNKPSKQDLQDVVASLQGIVDKDEEIVAVLNQTAQQAQTTATTLQNTGRDDRNLTAQRLAELQNELQNQRERLRQAAEQRQELAADLREAQQGRTWRDALLAGLALACVGLLLRRRRR